MDTDKEKIVMLDTLGYLRNGCIVWTYVPKSFSLDSDDYSAMGGHLVCENKIDGKTHHIDFIPVTIISKLCARGLIDCRIELDTSNASNNVLICSLVNEGEQWYLGERDKYAKSLHHQLK